VAEVEAWPIKLRAALDRIVARIEMHGLMSLTEEHATHLRGRIWDLRARADGNIGRALYVTVTGRRLIIVLCAIKKTQATPKRWIDLAEARAREFDRGGLT
jgi:phage-related protein